MKDLSRTEEKIIRRNKRRKKIRHFSILLLCLFFFLAILYIADVSTSKMLKKDDDKHAIYAKYQEDGFIRVDMAGKTVRLYIVPILEFFGRHIKR